MSSLRPGSSEREWADKLLTGDSSGIDRRHRALAELLAAAAAPARPHELAGEQAALTAFRVASANPPPPARKSAVKEAVMRAATFKIGLAALATTAAGATALAASTGTLPNPLTDHRPTVTSSRSPTSPSIDLPILPGDQRSADASSVPSLTPSPPDPGSMSAEPSVQQSNSTSSTSLVKLCQTYMAGNKSQRGRALDSPKYAPLVEAARGKANVDAFCTQLLTSAAPTSTDPSGGGAMRSEPSPTEPEPSESS